MICVWYEMVWYEERYLGQVKQKVKGSRGKEGEVYLKMSFGVRQVPQDFKEEKHHCFYKKVCRTTVKPTAVLKRSHKLI